MEGGSKGGRATSSPAPNVLLRVCWLEHLTVLQASPADAREAVPETNDSAVQGRGDDAVGEIARELVARTGRTLH